MKTDRFNEIRLGVLKNVFAKKKIIAIWRSKVKSQLRNLDLKDLYDYYDFNYNIEDRSLSIYNEVSSGAYKSHPALIYKIEKKLGISRQLLIPQPTDALTMQVITESIYPKIEKAKKSKNAFYSRDKSVLKKPHEVDSFGYEDTWSEQWKRMQAQIYNFKDTKNLLVVTDLTNYFDSIDLSVLRETILRYVEAKDEVLIDLLFRIIEEISWKPDYLPYRKHGLPTINTESIRLLGHAFLFELDQVLQNKTKGNFVRWMDDITFGVDTKDEAVSILSGISDVLKSRGLALNLSKTELYNSDEAEINFLIDTNRYLDNFSLIKTPSIIEKKELKRMFVDHLKNKEPKRWDKVTKRFISTFAKNNFDIDKYAKTLYISYPTLRPNVATYFATMGYSIKRSKCLLEIIDGISVHDDLSTFHLCKVLTGWAVPNTVVGIKFLSNFTTHITNYKDPFQFYCLIWLKSKYEEPKKLLKFIIKYKNFWQKNTFLRRQVTATLSRLYLYDPIEVEKLLNEQINSGVVDVMSIATQILTFAKLEKLNTKLRSYLFPSTLNYYSLERFLVLSSALNSKIIREDANVQSNIKKYIKDPFIQGWLRATYGIN